MLALCKHEDIDLEMLWQVCYAPQECETEVWLPVTIEGHATRGMDASVASTSPAMCDPQVAGVIAFRNDTLDRHKDSRSSGESSFPSQAKSVSLSKDVHTDIQDEIPA